MRTSPPDHDRVMNGCMGLIGEAGEIVDVLKKWIFQSGSDAEFPEDKILEECGDVLWYCAELATGLDIKIGGFYKVLSENISEKNRIPIGRAFVVSTACRLLAVSVRPFFELCDTSPENRIPHSDIFRENQTKNLRMINTIDSIVKIMVMIERLSASCSRTLSDTMEMNIEKLRRRYPDGFDAERSLHREE